MIVSASYLDARQPRPGEDYDAFLESFGLLGCGFEFGEIVRAKSPRHVRPPRSLWSAMVPTLALALELRERMLVHGARGLLVAAAFRPTGGAADSRHVHNAALDLDLMPGDERLQLRYAETVAELWREHKNLRVGAGTYAPASSRGTHRVHLDTGWRFRCWQGLPGGGWARRPAILDLAFDADDLDQPLERHVAGVDVDCVRVGSAWPS